jgi:hypothetical protein
MNEQIPPVEPLDRDETAERVSGDPQQDAVTALTEIARRAQPDAAGHRHAPDAAHVIPAVMAAAAAHVGGIEALLGGRSGSWEPDLVRQLVDGTADTADSDDRPWAFRTEPGRADAGQDIQAATATCGTADARPGETGETAEERTAAPARPVAADRSAAAGDQHDDTERDDDSASIPAAPTAGAVPSGVQLDVQRGVHPGLYSPPGVQPVLYNALSAELADPGPGADEPADPAGMNTRVEQLNGAVEHPAAPVEHPVNGSGEVSPRDRARTAAARHVARHGALPTVSELEALAAVSRGTAAAALKALREHPSPLHLVPDTPNRETQP